MNKVTDLGQCPNCGSFSTALQFYDNPLNTVPASMGLIHGFDALDGTLTIARQHYKFVYWKFRGEWFRARQRLNCVSCDFEWDGVSTREWISRNRWKKMQRRS